ncbi:transposase [Streptomyces sp. NPDC017405]|uniref:transposase n=1 Tax=unclassified Streptomyces TaxID=2593676 RepID=UPI0037B9A596
MDTIDETRAWGIDVPLVVADGDAAAFRLGPEERGLGYAVGVSTTTTAQPQTAQPHTPPYGGRGPRTVSARLPRAGPDGGKAGPRGRQAGREAGAEAGRLPPGQRPGTQVLTVCGPCGSGRASRSDEDPSRRAPSRSGCATTPAQSSGRGQAGRRHLCSVRRCTGRSLGAGVRGPRVRARQTARARSVGRIGAGRSLAPVR